MAEKSLDYLSELLTFDDNRIMPFTFKICEMTHPLLNFTHSMMNFKF